MRNFFVIILLFLSPWIYSQSTLSFHTRFGSDQDEVANSIIQSVTGEYIVLGQTTGFGALQTDILLTKTDKFGIPIWQKVFGGFGTEDGKSVVELSDSSIVFVGYTSSYGNGGYDVIIYKTDKNGILLWQKTFGGTDWDFGYSINKTADGNLIVCGATYSFGKGNTDGFVLKLDYNGNFLWNKIYGGGKEDVLKKIIQTNEGGYIAVGTTKSYGDSLGDIWVTKLNNLGDSTWFLAQGGSKMEVGNAIVQDKNGDYLITGGSESYTNGKEDAYIFKITNGGIFVWDRFYGSSNNDEESYDVLNSGSTYGSMLILHSTKEITGALLDIKNLLLDAGGYYIRGGSFGGTQDDIGYSMCNTKDKGYIACGYTESFNAIGRDIFIVKYDSEMTIGPLVVGIDKFEEDIDVKIYPTIITENKFNVRTSKKSRKINMKIIDIYGRIIEPIMIEEKENNLFLVTISSSIKGVIFIMMEDGLIFKKCLVN